MSFKETPELLVPVEPLAMAVDDIVPEYTPLSFGAKVLVEPLL
jgi:hypothetical protein